MNGRVFKMASQEILINVIKKIHNKRKRADLDSIMIEAKDIELSTDEIVKLLETLCQENTLKLVSRDGENSYRFNKTVVDEAGNTNKDSIDDDEDSIDDDEDSTDDKDDKERNEQVGASNINPENFSLEQDIRSSMYFGILTDIIKSVSDLKNFLDFKMG